MRIGGPSRRRAAAILLAALAAPGGGAAAAEDADAAVLRRIEALRGTASQIRVDGRARDWKGIPSFEDRDAAPIGNPALDIVRLSVAPREGDVVVLLETKGPTSRQPYVFGFDVDFLGKSGWDASVRVGAGGACGATLFPEGWKPERMELSRLQVEAAEALEVRIPLEPLVRGMRTEEAKRWLEGTRRSFVRVQAWTSVPGGEARVDEGPAAASFRLATPPPVLDPPVAAGEEARRAVALPLDGKWFVRQGPNGLWTHQDLFAYDLVVEDHALKPTPVPGSRRLEDYPSWGRQIIAREAGSVVFGSLENEDRPPLEKVAGRSSGNTLIVRFADGMRLSFGHLRKDSVALRRDEEFGAGAVLAEVGNSGDSGAPHLHLSLHERPGDFTGLPLAFRGVRVGLNPGADDPWARDLPEWAVREGWFVEASPAK